MRRLFARLALGGLCFPTAPNLCLNLPDGRRTLLSSRLHAAHALKFTPKAAKPCDFRELKMSVPRRRPGPRRRFAPVVVLDWTPAYAGNSLLRASA